MDLSFATQLVLWVQLCLISCVKNQMWVRYEWLMSSSKLQPCLELCQFAQALLKIELQGGNAFPYWHWQGDPITIFFWTDGILLEIRNRKERFCSWTRVATTSHIIT
jgi:hypothetical protein